MDDWPRISFMFNSKYNIDASAWMYFYSEKMAFIAGKIGYFQK